MNKTGRTKRVKLKISELERSIKRIESDLSCAAADRKNPLSREFPSAIQGHDNLAATLARELENAQSDLTILRQSRSGALEFGRAKFLRKQLPEFLKMRENIINIVNNMQAELAAIERARQLLR